MVNMRSGKEKERERKKERRFIIYVLGIIVSSYS